MAVAFVQNHTGTGQTNAGTTNLSLTIGATKVTAGNTLFAVIAMDNLSATTPTVSSIDKMVGETNSWVLIASVDSSTATAAAAVRGELWGIQTTVDWTASSSYVITISGSIGDKACVPSEFSGVSVTARGISTSGTSTGGTPAGTTAGTALVSSDLVIGGGCFESNTAITGDTDTTNGTWSTVFSANSGGSTNANSAAACIQYKIVNATGAQAYNPVGPATDSGALAIGLQPLTVVLPGNALGTGTANDATVITSVDVSAASVVGAGAANNATTKASVSAGNALGAGVANDATTTSSGNATAASVVGAGAANNATTKVSVGAGNAPSTGTANDATVTSVGSGTDASAGSASGSGAANGVTGSVRASAENAPSTGTANAATTTSVALTEAQAGNSSGVGAANNATTTVNVASDYASGSGVSNGVVDSLRTSAESSAGAGTAYGITTTPAAFADAGEAVGTGTAGTAATTSSGDAAAEFSVAVGAGNDASTEVRIISEAAAGYGAVYNAAGLGGMSELIGAEDVSFSEEVTVDIPEDFDVGVLADKSAEQPIVVHTIEVFRRSNVVVTRRGMTARHGVGV